MIALPQMDALFILGKDLSIVRSPGVLARTENRMSPFSIRNALAGVRIVQQGYDGALVFVSGPTWCAESEAARIKRAFDGFLGVEAPKVKNKFYMIENTFHTGQDIDASLRLIEEVGFKSPAILSCENHQYAIGKLLKERGRVIPLLFAESFLSKDEMNKLRDWRVPLEIASEVMFGWMLSPRTRSKLAELQRPGARK